MKVRGIKINYILNVLRTVLTTLIGLFTMPYINRTLGVESVGKVEYVNSIITYFVLISALGIPMYGVREIARVRDNIRERTYVVFELLLILFATTIVSYIVLFTMTFSLFTENGFRELIFVLCPIILLTNIGAEWFFQGVEDQLYITIRFIIIKIITIILLFTFVKTADDYIIYAAITGISAVGGNLFNFYRIKKYVNFKLLSIRRINIRRHLSGVFTVFLATISVSIYLQLDITLLGTLGGDQMVGLYATANKLVRFSILFITTLGAVMLPRLSYLYDNSKISEYNAYLSKSLQYILFFSIPITGLIFSLSREIILIMAGEKFLEAASSMKILSFLVVVIGIAYYLAFMILYPQGKEPIYTKIVVISAILSVLLNIIFIPKFFHFATSCISVFVEVLGIVLMTIACRQQLVRIGFFNKSNLHYLLAGVLMCLVIHFIPKIDHLWLYLVLTSLAGCLSYVGYLFIIKDSLLYEIYERSIGMLRLKR